MPRQEIELPYRIDYLSILDEQGKVDQDLEPDVDKDFLLKLHRGMLLGRRFDERLLQLQRQGRMGTFAPITGQEAAQIGAVAALEDSDWLVPSFREMAAEIWRGKTMENVILLYAGYNEGGAIPDGLNNLPIAIPVGTQTLHAAGIAYAMKYRQEKHVAMVFFGDGATSEGDFHEALNFAGVFQVPVVFVCQNNHWAISIPRSKQTRSKTLAQKALAYGVPGIQVDGNDVLAVYSAAREAVERARSGDGPSMIECVTYRMSVHTTADDPKRYRREEDVEGWVAKDPITRFEKYLKSRKIFTDKKIEAIEAEIKQEIKEAVERSEKKMEELGDPLLMFDHVFAELPPYLREQHEELRKELRQDST
ncbi:pyruvate dehydrogenase (acetyl-transferring) E1 component subunit alpha [Desulfoferrobacter suflitae]|uniref:pyruvate dehydrogenase (acetyl-transferring) E1 component subunit alpha n=1 Tax=Desulfoferrobacter suflitae TaxID=2865782 RepID=UPI002164AF56|nr:pyruvate dehydrogenase (acetyl-transferring) E1 component subunit alpha [Desulfoferrobacter suflitae]MCK8601644.1 pyruvate dehydrogenase (acetyl-transferring) E1 component subunit alpha [Desulfoferrobacter suflitae]